jgi:hypothetical protein
MLQSTLHLHNHSPRRCQYKRQRGDERLVRYTAGRILEHCPIRGTACDPQWLNAGHDRTVFGKVGEEPPQACVLLWGKLDGGLDVETSFGRDLGQHGDSAVSRSRVPDTTQ